MDEPSIFSDPEVCRCHCHKIPGGELIARHREPCCERCPHCGRRIAKGLFSRQFAECPKRAGGFKFKLPFPISRE